MSDPNDTASLTPLQVDKTTDVHTNVNDDIKQPELPTHHRMATDQLLERFNPNEVIKNVPLLSSLSKSNRKKLIRGLKKREFNVGDYLMREGEEGDSFFIIVKGRVEVSTESTGPVAELHPGDYAGEQSLIKSARRNASLRAVERTTCLVCNSRTFHSVLQQNANIHFAHREAKRKAVLTTFHENKDDGNVVDDKPPETVEWLLECVQDNLLFMKLDRNQREAVVRRMRLIEIEDQFQLIVQGDAKADTFYVCENGTFDVLVDGVKVMAYERGGCFGELALLYDNPRAATVMAIGPCRIWEVDRSAFRYEVQTSYQQKANENIAFLRQVGLFQPLLSRELALVADALDVATYPAGTELFAQGDAGEKFYIIKEGTATWSKANGESGDMGELVFFGERAIRTAEPRAASIHAKTDLVCLEMPGTDFTDLLGPVLELIDEQIKGYGRSAGASGGRQGDEEPTGSTDTAVADTAVCGLTDLVQIGILGKGAFGLVSLVVDPNTNKSYALKAIKKCQIVELGQQAHIISEKRVMAMMTCKFLINLCATYKDQLRVYFLLDACLGGELFTILRQRRYFDEPTSRFYTACVVEAFDYMHKRDIIYRDLKPENLVLDTDGYLKVTDFGFAKVVPDKTFTLCGTPDYLAPEIVTGQGHGKAVDWWTLGVLIYEMLASFPPFFDDEPIETYRKIIKGRIKFPRYFSQEARDLIRGLLRSKPTKRLGILKGGAANIQNHPWFYGFDWGALNSGQMPAPIVNRVRDARDLSNFVNNDDDEDDEDARPIAPEDDFDDEF